MKTTIEFEHVMLVGADIRYAWFELGQEWRLTGRWRIVDGDDMELELVKLSRGLFGGIKEARYWKHEDQIRFVTVNGCSK